MFRFAFPVFAALLLVIETIAQETRYTVWSSVIFSRTGDRTPDLLGTLPVALTSLGAQQQYTAGAYFRQRYISSFGSVDGVGSAPIAGLSPDLLNNEQLYINALDEQYTIASAQAFLQGLYPPYSLAGNNSATIIDLDQTLLLSNNQYEEPPLNGYQYPSIQTSDEFDPLYVFIDGSAICPAWNYALDNYILSPEFALTLIESETMYQNIGPAVLTEVLPPEEWNYGNAYAIYDYLNYQNVHNSTFAQLLSQPQYSNIKRNTSAMNMVKWYADQQTFATFGDLQAINNITGGSFPTSQGSISTIAGSTLAAKMLSQLQLAVETRGQSNKLSLLFGDFEPFVSFFALAALPPYDINFYGIPDYASTMVLELFSYTSIDDGTVFPTEDNLWVRFYYRNGTATDAPYTSYGLFNNGPDESDMPWNDFQGYMNQILIGDVGIWCQQCGSPNLFCAYWNESDSISGILDAGSSSRHHGVSPAVGGVIGAIVALVIAGILFGAFMLLGGVRFYRVNKSHKSDLGGFKGSQKLASDKDLVLPKGGAVVGASVETPGSPVAGGHERVGSWELKQNEAGLRNIAEEGPRRPSFEDDDVGDIGAAPFREPVKPDERV